MMPTEMDTGSENDKNPLFVWYQHNNMNCYIAQRSSIQDSIKHSFIVIEVCQSQHHDNLLHNINLIIAKY